MTVAFAVPLVVPEESATGEPLVMEQLGSSDAPDGDDVSEQLRATLPVYPPLPCTVMVEVALPPGEIALGVVALTEYVDAGAATIAKPISEVWTSVPEVPVTVRL